MSGEEEKDDVYSQMLAIGRDMAVKDFDKQALEFAKIMTLLGMRAVQANGIFHNKLEGNILVTAACIFTVSVDTKEEAKQRLMTFIEDIRIAAQKFNPAISDISSNEIRREYEDGFGEDV